MDGSSLAGRPVVHPGSPRVRVGDPVSSHEAADATHGCVGASQAAVKHCACGCGTAISDTKTWVHGHNVRRPEAERFWGKVTVTGFCWEWNGALSYGYGSFRAGGRTGMAHRWAFTFLVGEIPDGADLDHLCRNTRCVNPDHLDPVSHRENMTRGFSATSAALRAIARGVCMKGHILADVGTYSKRKNGVRCAQCVRDRSRLWEQRKRAASKGLAA